MQHLFFDCVVAKQLWEFISEVFNIPEFQALMILHCCGVSPKTNAVLNMMIAASLWSIWKLRSEFCFQGRSWRSVKCILAKLDIYLNQWKILFADAQAVLLRECIRLLNRRRGELLRIAWRLTLGGRGGDE